MPRNLRILFVLVLALCVLHGSKGYGQSLNASLTGVVKDPSGAAVTNAEVTLKFLATDTIAHVTSGADGSYSFVDLLPGRYELAVSAKGFSAYSQTGIELTAHETAHQNVQLRLGTANEIMEVRANASPINTENAEVKGTITPEVLENLPLIVAGTIRTAANFVVLEPGVSNGSSTDPASARINGGIQGGDEMQVDGISMQEGLWGTSGMWAANDYPMSPDSVSEVSVLSSSYDAEFGASTSGQITVEHKSGTDRYHGALYEYAKNTAFNAAPFGQTKPVDQEHEFGGNLGGPMWIPKLWPKSTRSFFFVNYEWFRNSGGIEAPVFTVPTMPERIGDFRDWVDSQGNLIPVYDPDTLRPNPAYNASLPAGPTNLPFLRDQFMGCNGMTPNVICRTDPRLVNSLAPGWFQWLPAPNRPGLLNNWVSPIVRPSSYFYKPYWLDLKMDQYLGNRDHVSYSLYWFNTQPNLITELPPQISANDYYGDPNRAMFQRINWDHTFSPKLINHTAIGYQNWNQGNSTVDGANPKYATEVPQIPGVQSHAYPPSITLNGFLTMGTGNGSGPSNLQNIPEFIVNDLVIWVKGRHTLKFGGEYRWIGAAFHNNWGESGSFSFSNTETGLEYVVTPGGASAGSSIASFLLGQVDSGGSVVRPPQFINTYGRQRAYILHASDTWKMTPKLSVDYGLRWDVFTPAWEKYDNMSYLDPTRPNPGAGNLPGALVFVGTKWGAASLGRRTPERTWYKGFAPRLGLAYSLTPKTVLRTGYGIFITQAFYQGWGGGVNYAQYGLDAYPGFGSTNAGMTAAFLLQNGLPQNFTPPPFIDITYANGQGAPSYRPFDGNRRPYSQQWNLTVERQVTNDFYFDVAYVGNKGTRLPSNIDPINVLNPTLLSMGNQLNDTFGPTDTVLDGVKAPYPAWASQMAGCAPTVAQALLPFPQYCGNIYGDYENKGNSTYHSFQVKAENRFKHGFWLLASYTNSKTLTDSDFTQAYQTAGTGLHGVISPFQQQRNKGLAVDDVPQTLSVALVYDLPFGKGKRWGARLPGPLRAVVGDWTVGSVFRATSGVPFWFRSSTCNVPGQFAAACIPAILPGANPWAQSKSDFDPNKPLFNLSAFDQGNGYNFYFGTGPRVSNLRGFGYHNQDAIFTKNIPIGEKVKFALSGQFFNMWNWHTFTSPGAVAWSNQQIIDTDIASPTFGMWNGAVSNPRYIQLAGRLTF